MLKIITVIGFLLLSIGGYAQKSGYYMGDPDAVNNHRYFYLNNCNIDIHDLTSPFIDKKEILKTPDYRYFVTYYELSLKNLTIIDSNKEPSCIIINIYEGLDFAKNMVYPANYKPRKLRTNHLILDMVSAGSGNLIYRSWIDHSRIKVPNGYNKEQYLVGLLLKGFTIQPSVTE